MGGEKKSPLRMLSRFRTIRGAMIFSYMAITLLALLIFLLFSLKDVYKRQVVGGGDVAIEDAIFLSRGCELSLIHI